MRRAGENLSKDRRMIENFEKAKKIIDIKYIEKLSERHGNTLKVKKVVRLLRKQLERCKLYENPSEGKNIGYYVFKENKIVVTSKGMALNDKYQLELLLHELLHLIQMLVFPRSTSHGREFKSLCSLIGYPQIGRATSRLRKDMFEDEEYYNKQVEKKKKKVESKVYKYFIVCADCGKTLKKYQRRSKIVDNPTKYRSRCCSGKIKSIDNPEIE